MEDGYGKNVYGNEKTKSGPEGQRHIGIKETVNAAHGVESNRVASTDLRETGMHEDAAAIAICFYYKVCKWRIA